MTKFSCVASGDAMVTKRLPQDGFYQGFELVRNYILQGAFRFTNLETTIHNFESYGAAQSGGSWLCSPPGIITDLRKFGFNILSTANNHALDYAYDGVARTIHYLKEADFTFAGTGMTLMEASAPAYLDTVNARYAMIACCMTFNPEAMAGEQTRYLLGRPGLNGIRISKKYCLPPHELEHLKRIAKSLHLNDLDNINRREGYLKQLEEWEQPFGKMMFEASEKTKIVSTLNENDMQRIISAIREARFMADYVIISFHNHEVCSERKEEVDTMSIDFAHRCIDAGADAIIGTGPHLLRPMEIYQGKPIFYCLGDFINQLETIQRAPEEMFAKQKMSGNARLDEMFENRSAHGKRGLCYDPVMFESVIPYWEGEDDKLTKLILMPIEEQFDLPRSRNGFPRPKADSGIIERFAEMSKPYGVNIKIKDGLGIVRL